MFKLEKVTRRWIIRSFAIIVAVLAALEVLVIALTHNSYYSAAQQIVNTRASVILNTLTSYSSDDDGDFTGRTRELIENFSDRSKMEIVAINRSKKATISSSGFAPQISGEMPDLDAAIASDNRIGNAVMKMSGEKVYCVSILSPQSDGEILSLRLMSSFSRIDRQLLQVSLIYILIGIIITIFILVVNLMFLHSIMKPVAEVEKTARRIAAGDFDSRIENRYKDEMGDLCDIVNYMADELSQSEKIKNEFISSVSHELRTPLTSIRGWGETLNDDINCSPEMRKKGLGVIINETERLSSIVEDLLDFSKIQSGRFTIKKEKMDLLAELEEAILVFSERVKREGKKINYNEPQMLSPVYGDKNRIRQVFVNILDNAIKYSEEGGEIDIVAGEEYGFVSVSIEDHGCGISAEDLPKITQKFFKGNLTRRGSGIGLAVVDEIVTALGGNLDIKSQPDVGTAVTVSFRKMPDNKEVKANE